jgi:hypothetical protein
MALLMCPDCEGKVSDQAAACPHCGRPMRSPATSAAAPTRRAASDVRVNKGVGTGVRIGFGMFIVLPLVLLGGCAFFLLVVANAPR